MHTFRDIKAQVAASGSFFIKVKETYEVRISPEGEATCTCLGDTYRIGGKKQVECKHVQAARDMRNAMRGKK